MQVNNLVIKQTPASFSKNGTSIQSSMLANEPNPRLAHKAGKAKSRYSHLHFNDDYGASLVDVSIRHDMRPRREKPSPQKTERSSKSIVRSLDTRQQLSTS